MPIFQELRDSSHHPIKLWTPLVEVEASALQQLKNTASLPFVFKHVAVMPDVHLGIGATVGSVVATKEAVCPAAVGVDIGCGMMAVKTLVPPAQVQDKLPKLRSLIESVVPVGFEGNKKVSDSVSRWSGWKQIEKLTYIDKELTQRARLQLGSLGGGNHFIEVCLDQEGALWVMLHSGSRNIGKTLAERHIRSAKGLLKEKMIRLPDPNLAYFMKGDAEYENYLADVRWCQEYAFENRQEMMRRILNVLSRVVYGDENQVKTSMSVNCHHNYVSEETHFGEKVLVTRKGAVRAGNGELGIIPGSMGARSYIVKGLGHPESFQSCAHGAGRRMSRTEAKKRFNLRDLARETEGVECRKDKGILDEIPSAYKDIDQVMQNQKDLVEVVAQLKQILCVKG